MNKKTVFITGCWDLFHVGHLAILQRAKALGDTLIVGVFADHVIAAPQYKGRPPVITCRNRITILSALECVDLAVELTRREYLTPLKKYQPDILAVGESWGTHPGHDLAVDFMKSKNGRVVRFPYTQGISSTQIKDRILTQSRSHG